MRLVIGSVLVGALVGVGVACSSSSDSSGSGSCSCSVSDNGASATVQCGKSACVNGSTYSCSESADISQGSACTATTTTSSSSSSSTGGTTTSSSSSTSSSSGAAATTVPCAYHDFDKNVDVTTCNAATQYCLRSYIQSEGPGSNNVCAPLPTGCASCDCASDNAEAAWKAAEDNTINCTGSTNVCSASNGAIIVDCVK